MYICIYIYVYIYIYIYTYTYSIKGDLAAPFWSTKDAGQTPFTFKIGLGQVIIDVS
jgi:hypothetical protein